MKRISEALIRDDIESTARFDYEGIRGMWSAIGPIKIGRKAIDYGSSDVSPLNKSRDFRMPSDFGFANAINVMCPPDQALVIPISSLSHGKGVFGHRSEEHTSELPVTR